MSEVVARAYKYRLYPTPDQERALSAWQVACWEIQRACILQRRWAWERYRISRVGKLPTWAEQAREITESRREFPHLAAVPADVTSAIVRRVDEAYKRMREGIKAGVRIRVRWADKPEHIGLEFRGQSERGTRLARRNGRFAWWRLASANRLGALKVRFHRTIPEKAEIRQVHITRAADGWYISFSCVMPAPAPLAVASRQINGVDLNVKHAGNVQQVAAIDDGRKYLLPDGLKRDIKRLGTLQKLVSKNRRTRGAAKAADPKSKRTARRRVRIARLHQRIARQREHVQQYIARRLVDTANVTAFEALNHRGMRRRGKGRRKRGLNRALSTAAPGRLIALTREKAEVAGRTVVTVDARGTTQACSACGAIGERKGLDVRRWTCASCGTEHDRDVNAARNIKARALRALAGDVEPPCGRGLRGEGGAPVRRKCPSANREDRQRSGGEMIRRRSSSSLTHEQLRFDFVAERHFARLQ